MKWMIKVVKTGNSPPPSSYVHSFLSTTKHLEKIQLHMVFTLFVNILKKFNKPKFKVLKKCPTFFYTHYFHKH